MATNKQRRDVERRRLQQQLAERRAKEMTRRRVAMISSVGGSLAVIVVIVVVIIAATSSSNDKNAETRAGVTTARSSSAPQTTTTSSSVPQCGQRTFPTAEVRTAAGATVTFNGVSVKGAADLGGKPVVTSKSSATPTKVEFKDLVVGRGETAKPTSCVDVQYLGALYSNGTEFDSSWKRSSLTEFSLTRVVPGFAQGIGGGYGIPAMKAGGRRLMIIPATLGYGSQASSGIPPNSPLVFVVDLNAVS